MKHPKKEVKRYIRVRKFADKDFSYIAKEITKLSKRDIEKTRYAIMRALDKHTFYLEEMECLGPIKEKM